jgi:NTE family protein
LTFPAAGATSATRAPANSYVNIGRGIFAGGSIETGNVWQQRNDVSASGLRTAGSVFLAADTWVGPFYLAYGRTSGGQSSFYVYLGRP